MGWLGGVVVGVVIGWIGQAWWKDQVDTASERRRPSPWLKHKIDGRFYRREGRALERDGACRDMVVLYDCQASRNELWPADQIERDFQRVEHGPLGPRQ